MTHKRPITTALRRFTSSEDGSISVEAMLILPILVWCYLATFVFFDAYRAQSTNLKAAYTIGDAISREPSDITPAYLDSLYRLLALLVDEDNSIMQLRVTVYRYQSSDDSYRVNWSRVRGGGVQMTDATLTSPIVRSRLPRMSNGDIAILVETQVGYSPAFSVGLQDFTFEDFVVTRPRIGGGQICTNSSNSGTFATRTC
jgi:hypothetical protein